MVAGDEGSIVLTTYDWPVVEPAIVVVHAPYGDTLDLVSIVLEELEEPLHSVVPVVFDFRRQSYTHYK